MNLYKRAAFTALSVVALSILGAGAAHAAGFKVLQVHSDHLGTPKAVSDDQGQVTWQASHTPFGAAIEFANHDSVSVRFPGQYLDGESGVHYNYHRYFDPSTGRYSRSDPIGLAGGINPYLYANANPLRFVDPYGLFEGPVPGVQPQVAPAPSPTSPASPGSGAGIGVLRLLGAIGLLLYPSPAGEGSDQVPIPDNVIPFPEPTRDVGDRQCPPATGGGGGHCLSPTSRVGSGNGITLSGIGT